MGVLSAQTVTYPLLLPPPRSGRLTLLTSRRLFNTVSQVAPAAAMVAMAYSGCSPLAAAALLVAGMWCNGALSAGHMARCSSSS